MENNEKIIEQLESVVVALKEISDMTKKDDITNLDKINQINMETGLDLIVIADNISKMALQGIKDGTSKDNHTQIILKGIAEFIGGLSEIKKLQEEEKFSEAVELTKKISKRNNRIYEILFEEKVDYSGLTAIQERKKQNEYQMKIVTQLTIMINEATLLSYEALLENAKKIMG